MEGGKSEATKSHPIVEQKVEAYRGTSGSEKEKSIQRVAQRSCKLGNKLGGKKRRKHERSNILDTQRGWEE